MKRQNRSQNRKNARPIYEGEELGDEEAITAILEENIDPTLSAYADDPLLPQIKESNARL